MSRSRKVQSFEVSLYIFISLVFLIYVCHNWFFSHPCYIHIFISFFRNPFMVALIFQVIFDRSWLNRFQISSHLIQFTLTVFGTRWWCGTEIQRCETTVCSSLNIICSRLWIWQTNASSKVMQLKCKKLRSFRSTLLLFLKVFGRTNLNLKLILKWK